MNKKDQLINLEANLDKYGFDKDSSEVIIDNLANSPMPIFKGTDFTEDELDTDQFHAILFAIDASGSMDDVAQELVDSFNDVLVPALKGTSKDVIDGIRVAAMAFSGHVYPLWNGEFHNINEVPKLTMQEYYGPGGGSTALNRAIIEGMSQLAAFSTNVLYDMTGTMPHATLVVLSDGGNNEDPRDPDDVRKLIGSRNDELVTKAFGGFCTGWGAPADQEAQFRDIARDLRFKDQNVTVMHRENGESDEEMKKRMRAFIGNLASSISQHVSTVSEAGGSNVAPGGFWQGGESETF